MADRSYRVGPPGSDLKMQMIMKVNLQKLKPAIEEKVPRTFFLNLSCLSKSPGLNFIKVPDIMTLLHHLQHKVE